MITKQQAEFAIIKAKQPYVEIPDKGERAGPFCRASTNRKATDQDIERELKLHKDGRCSLTLFVDEKGWLYDYRTCAICGAGIGMI